MNEALRAVLAIVIALLAVAGLCLFLKRIGIFVSVLLEFEREEEEDFVSSMLYAGTGFIAISIVGLILWTLYLIGADLILPIFGL